MYEKEAKKEQIDVILREVQQLNESDSDNDLLKELEHVHEILDSLNYDWEKVVGHMIGLWKNYAGNPDIPEDKKKRVNALIHQSVGALRKLSENREYLQNTHALTEQLIIKAKELKS